MEDLYEIKDEIDDGAFFGNVGRCLAIMAVQIGTTVQWTYRKL